MMKKRILSLGLAAMLIVSSVFGTGSANVAKAVETPEPVSFEVEGEVAMDTNGSWNIASGTETDTKGEKVTYIKFTSQWANGRFIVNFPYAGTYKMQMVMAVPTVTSEVHLEMAQEGGSFKTIDGDIQGIEETKENEYKTFSGPDIVIEEPGNYDLKFGSWVEGATFKLDKFIFSCESPIAPPEVDKNLVLKKNEELVMKEAMAVNQNGSLRLKVEAGNYVDYSVKVEEAGDYTLAYFLGANDSKVENAYQISFAEKKDVLTDADFTLKLNPMTVTHYYGDVVEKQSVHLEAGEYIVRTKALEEGFTINQVVISDKVTHTISEDPENPTTIAAPLFDNATGYHAVENATNVEKAQIGYTENGLGLDYDVVVAKGGVYDISYRCTSNGEKSLTSQRVVDGEVIDLATSTTISTAGSGDWYEQDRMRDTEAVQILLPEGNQTFRVHWDGEEINLKSFTFKYVGSAVDFVKQLIQELPAKADLELTDKEAVVKAKSNFDALTADEKTEVGAELTTKLEESIAQIDTLELEKAIEDNKKELEREFAKYDENDYREERWLEVIAAKDAGLEAIANATTISGAENELKAAKAAMEAVVKKLKPITISEDTRAILAQSKAYRKNGFLNSNVEVGNYADYYVNVAKEGDYTFTYAIYSEEAEKDAFSIKYDASEYPEEVKNVYTSVSVPKITEEGNLVKEIRTTVHLLAGEQTLRFETNSVKVRLNRITIEKKDLVNVLYDGVENVIKASSFVNAENNYAIAGDMVTDTEASTVLEYAVEVPEKTESFVSIGYAYYGDENPAFELEMVDAENKATKLASIETGEVDGNEAETEQVKVTLPEGAYTLRLTIKNDDVNIAKLVITNTQKVVKAEDVSLNSYKINLKKGGSFQLAATVTPENATSSIQWTTSNVKVADVDENGLVKAIGDGTAYVSATIDDVSVECQVVVGTESTGGYAPVTGTTEKAPTFISNVQTEVETECLYAGGDKDNKVNLDIIIPTGATAEKIEYTSKNPEIATVSKDGTIVAKKSGTAVITVKVTLSNGESVSMTKKIEVKKAKISMSAKSYTVKKGASTRFEAETYGLSSNVTYKLATKKDKKLAKLSKGGKFIAKGKGTVTVIAQCGDIKKTFKVKVK